MFENRHQQIGFIVIRLVKWVGCVLCLAAVLSSLGGQWLILQTIAWARMFATFSQRESMVSAVSKTFDGKHPCSLCHQVSEGWQKQKQNQERQPWLQLDKQLELYWETPTPLVLKPAVTATAAVPFVPALHADFVESPPAPPPRADLLAA